MPPYGLRQKCHVALILAVLMAGSAVFPPHVAASPSGDPTSETEQAWGYLNDLVTEINARRAWAGTPPVSMAPLTASASVSQYLADITPAMLASGSCFHGAGNPVAHSWDYVANTGLPADGRGEVMACPASNYWTAPRIAQSWWGSAVHRGILYADATVNLIACGTFGPQRAGAAYLTIACATFRG